MPEPTTVEIVAFFIWLIRENGYRDVRRIGDRHYAAIYPKAFTHAIVLGRIDDEIGYDDTWCYPDYRSARHALDEWNGIGEPTGWIRHPPSGRRISPPEGAVDGDGNRVAPGELYVRE